MGGGLTGLVLALVILVLLATVIFFVFPLARERQKLSDEINAPQMPRLEYHVPEGQDPAAILTALRLEGYHATVHPTDTQRVRVACPAGLDRERARVRAVIANAGSSAIDAGVSVEQPPVRFDDERERPL